MSAEDIHDQLTEEIGEFDEKDFDKFIDELDQDDITDDQFKEIFDATVGEDAELSDIFYSFLADEYSPAENETDTDYGYGLNDTNYDYAGEDEYADYDYVNYNDTDVDYDDFDADIYNETMTR